MNDQNGLINLFKTKVENLKKQLAKLEEESLAKDEQIKEGNNLRDELVQEVSLLTRKIGVLENDLEETERNLKSTKLKLEDLSFTSEECERERKKLQEKQDGDNDRIYQLELLVKEATDQATEAEYRYEEVSRKLAAAENLLEDTEIECESTEKELKQIQSEMSALSNSLKVMEKNQAKVAESEKQYEQEIKKLKEKLNEAENRARVSEKELIEKQIIYNKLEDTLEGEKRSHHLLQNDMQRLVDEFQQL